MFPWLNLVLSLALGAAYSLVAWQDLRRREIGLWAPLLICALSLLTRAPVWWASVGVSVWWPWRKETALLLLPVIIVAGWATGDLAPALSLTSGLAAWAWGWWGGVDAALLAALALRYDAAGMVGGSVTMAVFGIAVLIARRQLLTLLPAMTDVLAAQPVAPDLTPAGRAAHEMPAATALAAAGVVLELFRWL